MQGEDDRFAALAAQVAQLLARIEALEAAQGSARAAIGGSATGVPEAVTLAPPDRRESPRPDNEGATGVITYAGTANFGPRRYRWQMERPVAGLLQLDASTLAPTLAALGHPLRLHIVRALMNGPRSRQRLQDGLGAVSTGQFYHHLRELLGVGLVTQRGRNVYALAAPQIIPLLTIIAATYDLIESRGDSAPDTPIADPAE